MYIFAYLLLVGSFLCGLYAAGAAVVQLGAGRKKLRFSRIAADDAHVPRIRQTAAGPALGAVKTALERNTVTYPRRLAACLPWVERGQVLITILMSLSSLALLYAFINYDFSLEYVASYSDRTLPLFYRVTAFWAGQSGSLLFWSWSVAISGLIFSRTKAYRNMGTDTKLWFWSLFLVIISFFLLLLTAWSNPFAALPMPPADGRGLNPLLQNPGMIFHPPLLFLGYGGFVVPGCLALAQTISGRLSPSAARAGGEAPWSQATRPFILVAWLLLTAGIILGAWWAYMELGWGGYWAWDPVENASLIPWLVATAYLHTAVIESRRGKLRRMNVMLMALTTISAFFATYLVRSGVVESLHAFGDGGVGTPLLLFTLLSLAFGALVAGSSPADGAAPLEGPHSKEGLLVMVAWALLALSLIILIATLWPVIINAVISIAPHLPQSLAARLPDKPMGLEAAFYNRTCLPLFAMLALLLLFCPNRQWKTGFAHAGSMWAVLGIFIALAGFFAWMALGFYGVSPVEALKTFSGRQYVTIAASAFAVAGICGLFLLFIFNPNLLRVRATLAAHGVHLGFLLIVLGVAFSGPYQEDYTLVLSRGQSSQIGRYTVRLDELYSNPASAPGEKSLNYTFVEAELTVGDKNGGLVGVLAPQRRWYSNFERQSHAEVSTLFSLGNELYATLLSLDESRRATILIHVNPLVNWLWIGGILMCLFPLLGLRRVKPREVA